jgi:hypothetical protein
MSLSTIISMVIELHTPFPITEVYSAGSTTSPGHRTPNTASLRHGICDIGPKPARYGRFLEDPFLLICLIIETIVALSKMAPYILRGLIYLGW